MVEVNWSRQLFILVLAAVFAYFWTGRQGVMPQPGSGDKTWEQGWKEAKLDLIRRLGQNFDVLDGSDPRGEKRMLILTASPNAKDPVPVVAGELIAITPDYPDPRFRQRRNAKSRAAQVRQPVGRLIMYSSSLDFLRAAYGGQGGRNHDSLIVLAHDDQPTQAKAGQPVPANSDSKSTQKSQDQEIKDRKSPSSAADKAKISAEFTERRKIHPEL